MRFILLLALPLLGGCNVPVTESINSGDPLAYSVLYSVSITRGSDEADVSMRVRQDRALLREVRFPSNPAISNLRIDGKDVAMADEIVWQPPATGGTLQWTAKLAHQRGKSHFDALLTDDWGVFRAEDLIPRAATRVMQGAFSKTAMEFDLPDSWSVITAYAESDNRYVVNKEDRNFDQPSGWIAVGSLGIRRENVAGVSVAVAAPTGQGVRRMDILALLNWTLPELARVVGALPPRLTIISASDPMWRGGLSGPYSLYIHADRPLISENATSTLLHEVMHSILRQTAAPGYDWIVEGFAEYYSLQLLRRSGTISEQRYRKAIADQREWAESADTLCRKASKAATTALAVTVMQEVDDELRKHSSGEASLDDVLQALQSERDKISLDILQQTVAQLAGQPSAVLQLDKLPGCRSIQQKSGGSQ